MIFQGDRWAVRVGHVLDVLRQMPEKCVQACVTSPPYFGLRAYGTNPQVWGGDPVCVHEWALEVVHVSDSAPSSSSTLVGNGHVGGGPKMHVDRPSVLAGFCQRCSAWRGEFGAEPTPDLYIEHLVTICREIRRVLRDDGTFWLNLGASYAADRSYQVPSTKGGPKHTPAQGIAGRGSKVPDGYQAKALIPVPWLAGIALQKDGWILRNDNIWSKADDDGGTCMPFPAVDRFVPSHEYVLLFSKQARYSFDWYAVTQGIASSTAKDKRRNAPRPANFEQAAQRYGEGLNASRTLARNAVGTGSTRRARTVWTVNVRPFKGAHFATFPAELAARCIQAGAPEGGACSTCGTALKRVVVKGGLDLSRPQMVAALDCAYRSKLTEAHLRAIRAVGVSDVGKALETMSGPGNNTDDVMRLAAEAKSLLGGYYRELLYADPSAVLAYCQRRDNGADANGEYHGQATKDFSSAKAQNASDVKRRVLAGQVGVAETRFERVCDCTESATTPCVVLDPFSGSGTTVAAASVLGRTGIGVELLELNAAMTEARVSDLLKRGLKPSRKDDTIAVDGEEEAEAAS